MNTTSIFPTTVSGARPAASSSIAGLNPSARNSSLQQTEQNKSLSFAQIFDQLNQSQAGSDELLQRLSTGENLDIHQVMLSAEENDVNFKVALAIRDRLVEAYHEVMRMSV